MSPGNTVQSLNVSPATGGTYTPQLTVVANTGRQTRRSPFVQRVRHPGAVGVDDVAGRAPFNLVECVNDVAVIGNGLCGNPANWGGCRPPHFPGDLADSHRPADHHHILDCAVGVTTVYACTTSVIGTVGRWTCAVARPHGDSRTPPACRRLSWPQRRRHHHRPAHEHHRPPSSPTPSAAQPGADGGHDHQHRDDGRHRRPVHPGPSPVGREPPRAGYPVLNGTASNTYTGVDGGDAGIGVGGGAVEYQGAGAALGDRECTGDQGRDGERRRRRLVVHGVDGRGHRQHQVAADGVGDHGGADGARGRAVMAAPTLRPGKGGDGRRGHGSPRVDRAAAH